MAQVTLAQGSELSTACRAPVPKQEREIAANVGVSVFKKISICTFAVSGALPVGIPAASIREPDPRSRAKHGESPWESRPPRFALFSADR